MNHLTFVSCDERGSRCSRFRPFWCEEEELTTCSNDLIIISKVVTTVTDPLPQRHRRTLRNVCRFHDVTASSQEHFLSRQSATDKWFSFIGNLAVPGLHRGIPSMPPMETLSTAEPAVFSHDSMHHSLIGWRGG